MKRFVLIVLSFLPLTLIAQKSNPNQPKLVVGIVIDQMRYDYLYAYWDKYSENGFKKLMKKGYNYKNTNYNYVPTFTAPGHASIYTGTTPIVHGIISNDWFDKKLGKEIYCTDDSTVTVVGMKSETNKMSPKNLISSTIGDELKLSNNGKSKVIGIALKDRAAILPAGHNANAAYWMDDSTGFWVSSTFYMNDLPSWVNDYNSKNRPKELLSKNWETILPIDQYIESWSDNSKYERPFRGEKNPVFPHNMPANLDSVKNKLGLIKATPFGNVVTREMAELAITNENLGKDNYTDLLCVSFSSPDYIGHQFGPKSIELEDCYIRLDLEIASLITYLEKQVGKNNFVLFLTADHAAADVPSYLMDQKIGGGYISLHHEGHLIDSLYKIELNINDESKHIISAVTNQQVYLNHELINEKNLNLEEVNKYLTDKFYQLDGVAQIYTADDFKHKDFTGMIPAYLQNGFHAKRSGDLIINLEPGWVEFYKTGTTHGSPYSYDTHVPLLWYGKNVPVGFSTENVIIPDIAATVCLMLDIPYTNGKTGDPLNEILLKYNRK